MVELSFIGYCCVPGTRRINYFHCLHHNLWKSCFSLCFADEETETQPSNLPEGTQLVNGRARNHGLSKSQAGLFCYTIAHCLAYDLPKAIKQGSDQSPDMLFFPYQTISHKVLVYMPCLFLAPNFRSCYVTFKLLIVLGSAPNPFCRSCSSGLVLPTS